MTAPAGPTGPTGSPGGTKRPPLHVVDSTAAASSVLRRLTSRGWTVLAGFVLPADPWDVTRRQLVVSGPVSSVDEVAPVVLAAARGAAVVAIAEPRGAAGRALLEDLRRIGPVAGTEAPGADAQVDGLSADQCALLDRLADGESIAAAAEAEFLSLRTANRRIAQARKSLEVSTTRAAVVEYVRRRDQSN